MTGAAVDELLASHIAAAVRAQKAGFQGVEVWAVYHSLLDQFWTPWSNKSTDQWGDSLQNRARFSRAMVEGIRRSCGQDLISGITIHTPPPVR